MEVRRLKDKRIIIVIYTEELFSRCYIEVLLYNWITRNSDSNNVANGSCGIIMSLNRIVVLVEKAC